MRRYLTIVLVLFLLILSGCERERDKFEPTLSFDETNFVVYVGDEVELVPVIENPDGELLVKFTIEDESVVKQEGNKFVALKEGQTTINATIDGFDDIKVEITIKVLKLHQITYHLDGGTLEDKIEQFRESDLPITLGTPIKEGYTFRGWYLESEFTNQVTRITTKGDFNVYAKWEKDIIEYSITYHLNGGTLQEPVNKFIDEDLPITLPIPTRDGFEFGGWFDNAQFTGTALTNITEAKDYNLYARWDQILDMSKVYVGVDVEGKPFGAIVSNNNTMFVVGRTAFSKFDEALAVATEMIFVGPGEYSESFTINKSNIQIIGPGKDIKIGLSAEELPKQEAVLSGNITLGNNVKNVTIQGLYFTKGATIKSTGPIEGFKFTYNKVINTNDATSTWALLRENVPAFLSLYNEDTNLSNISKNIEITNNHFIDVPEYIISLARVDGLLIAYNEFKNFKRDAVRVDGGYNGGRFTIQFNKFENDTLSGYNGIYFRIYGGDSDGRLARHTIEIYHNSFKNIGKNQDLSGAISARNYNEFGAKFDIKYNTFENVTAGLQLRNNATVDNHAKKKWIAEINHNGFIGIPTRFYFNNQVGNESLETNPALANLDQNYFEDNNGNPITDLSTIESKIINVASKANPYQTRTEFETFVTNKRNSTPENIEIANPVYRLNIYETYQLRPILLPEGVDQRFNFETSDTSIALVSPDGLITALKEGTVVITVRSYNRPTLRATLEIVISKPAYFEVEYEGSGTLAIGESLDINYSLINVPGNETIEWISSDESVLKVNQSGKVTAVGAGSAIITIKALATEIETTVGLTVYDGNEIDPLLKYLIQNNRGKLFTKYIGYYGSDVFYNRIYNTVNRFFPEPLDVEEMLLPTSRSNHPNRKMDSVEYITVHDTGNSGAGSTARANGNFLLSSSAASWHYTVGNDGVFKHMQENDVAWHAGDGGDYFRFQRRDTGVKATNLRPKVTLQGGYLYFNGEKSNIQAPNGATRINDENHLLVTIGANGNYFIGNLWSNNGVVVNKGGNYNAVGIEMAVNHGSDVYYTWQRTSKLVADIMVRNNLTLTQVGFHRHFSNKLCPQTMIRAGLQDEFLKLVEVEYMIRKDFNDYEITFTSLNPEIIDNTGRVVEAPLVTTNVQYVITIRKGNITQSVTLNALVPGQYSWV